MQKILQLIVTTLLACGWIVLTGCASDDPATTTTTTTTTEQTMVEPTPTSTQ